MQDISLRFFGVRGGTPISPRGNTKYGGNTPCIEIRADGRLIICDAGTGIRTLGDHLIAKGGKVSADILISHIHWDHISGLPFFSPLYKKGTKVTIIAPRPEKLSLKSALAQVISPPYFPVSLTDVPATVRVCEAGVKPFKIGRTLITPFLLYHPGGALGWRFDFENGYRLAYVSDNEPVENPEKLIAWVRGADILIHDASFTPAEYKKHKGWGHSPYTYPVRLALAGGVKRLMLSHFNPAHTDRMIEKMLQEAKNIISTSGLRLSCSLASEGKVVKQCFSKQSHGKIC